MNTTTERARERIACPLCAAVEFLPWAEENGYSAVRCASCGLIYVNPRPALTSIDQAVRSGVHTEESLNLNVKARRDIRGVARYRAIIGRILSDVFAQPQPISWLDVGAGYGELVEAVGLLAAKGSTIEGIEPMKPKVAAARAKGLAIQEGYLADVRGKYDFVSAMNVFSHVPDFHAFLQEVRSVLRPGGEVIIETGNAADVGERRNFPNVLTLPDHLVFGGESQIARFLSDAGFEVVRIDRYRIDGFLQSAKNLVKRGLGRPVPLRLPYTSPTRTLVFRARMTG